MMSTAVDKLMEYYPYPVIAPILGMPNYYALVERIYQISYNTAFMQTELGGGKLGFIMLSVYPTVYTTLYTTPFIKPLNPSLAPTIKPNSNGIKNTSIQYKFILDIKILILYTTMDKATKNIYF